MTLQEYLNQADPQRDVEVILNETEYKVIATATVCDHVISAVKIPAIAERYGIEGVYAKVDDDKRLYTPDPHTGLPKTASVFYLS